MDTKTGNFTKAAQTLQDIATVPANAAREYIADMLNDLCAVAKQSGQDDLHALLKLTTQAVRSAAP